MEAANKISESFAAVSQKFEPIRLDKLPSYRPTLEPPKIHPYQVADKISKMKKTRSTLDGDLPLTLCKEFSIELAIPLENIFNSSPEKGEYPDSWTMDMCHQEYVSPGLPTGWNI